MFNLGNNYIENKDDNDFYNPRRAICPKCGQLIIRRVSEGYYYFTCCRRVWRTNEHR